MKYGELTLGQMEAIVNKLGGMDGVSRLLSGELVVKAAERTFTVWKTIFLGLHGSVKYYEKTLKSSGFQVSNFAQQILKKISLCETEVALDLVVVTVGELGFKNGATFRQICDRAKKLGLQLCPAEVGPVLRLDYPDQSCGEWLWIAMEPIPGSGGVLRVFSVVRDDGARWLSSDWFCSGNVWRPARQFVFVGSRK